MKARLLLIAAGLAALALGTGSVARGHEIERPGRFGLGVAVGFPTLSLTTNTFLADWMSVQVNLGAPVNFHGVHLEADYLFWLHEIVKHRVFDLTWYVGPGAGFLFLEERWDHWGKPERRQDPLVEEEHRLVFAGTFHAAIGLAVQFHPQPFDLIVQFTPGVSFGPDWAWAWYGGCLAFRYYF